MRHMRSLLLGKWPFFFLDSILQLYVGALRQMLGVVKEREGDWVSERGGQQDQSCMRKFGQVS